MSITLCNFGVWMREGEHSLYWNIGSQMWRWKNPRKYEAINIEIWEVASWHMAQPWAGFMSHDEDWGPLLSLPLIWFTWACSRPLLACLIPLNQRLWFFIRCYKLQYNPYKTHLDCPTKLSPFFHMVGGSVPTMSSLRWDNLLSTCPLFPSFINSFRSSFFS